MSDKVQLQLLAEDLDDAQESVREAVRDMAVIARRLTELSKESWLPIELNVNHAFRLPLIALGVTVEDATTKVVVTCETFEQADFIVAVANAAGGFR